MSENRMGVPSRFGDEEWLIAMPETETARHLPEMRVAPDRTGAHAAIADAVRAILVNVGEDPSREGLLRTPERVARAYDELLAGYRADPAVPGLGAIAWKEIERRADAAGVPMFAVRGALALPSSGGRSYAERIDAVKTERQLSEVFEDFIAMVPLGKTFLADRNPVRTGGPMQVSIAFAEALGIFSFLVALLLMFAV